MTRTPRLQRSHSALRHMLATLTLTATLIPTVGLAATDSAGTLIRVLATVRASTQAAQATHQATEKAERHACEAAEHAHEALQNDSSVDATRLAALSTRAKAGQRQCTEAKAAARKAKLVLDGERLLLVELADRLSTCLATGSDACGPAPQADAIKALIQAAAGAQATVDTLRKKSSSAYDTGDEATAAALKLDRGQLGTGPAARAALVKDATDWGTQAQDQPAEQRKAVSDAQRAANRLVAEAHTLKGCSPDDLDCTALPFVRALQAQARLAEHKSHAELAEQKLATANHGLAVLTDKPDIKPDLVPQAIAFRKTLDANPDVKSFFGGDAVGLSAGTAGGAASIRYTMENRDVFGFNRLSLIGSTAEDKSGRTNFVTAADKLKDKTSLQLVYQMTNAGFRLPKLGTVNDFAIGATVTREEHAYYEPGATASSLTRVERAYRGAGLGIRWAFLPGLDSGQFERLLVLSFDAQRSFEASKSANRCPVEPAAAAGLTTCVQGSLGAPTRVYTRLAGIEYRQRFSLADLGIHIAHSREDDKTDVSVPLYFIRNRDDAKNSMPFSGGISLNWSSGTSGVKWGLFVSTPLSFAKPER